MIRTVFPYLAINARGASRDDDWRDGLWTIRGDTLDDEIKEKLPLKEVVSGAGTVQESLDQIIYLYDIQVSWSACADGQSGFEVVSVDEELSGGVMAEVS